MKVAFFGTGYVGLTTGVCLAELGHSITCVDIEPRRIEKLNAGQVPFYEPGLDDLLKKNHAAGRIDFTLDGATATRENEVIFIAVGTPTALDGRVDMSQVMTVAETIGSNLNSYKVIVNKSTVPPGTGEKIKALISATSREGIDIVSNPEFLKEGSALNDFMESDRVVIGVESERASNVMKALYAKLNCPILVTDIVTAEIIKYASNTYLAASISFINTIAGLCEQVGGDVGKVAEGMRLDKRIGRKAFLNAGLGYGGSCFPKDVKGLIQIYNENGLDVELLQAVEDINKKQRERFIEKIRLLLPVFDGATMGVWGLAFKPGSDDIREAPAVSIAERLLGEGARLKAYDPVASANTKKLLPNIQYCKSALAAADECDCLLIMTEWDEFKTVDLSKLKHRLKTPFIIDGRNVFNPLVMEKSGFKYISVGR